LSQERAQSVVDYLADQGIGRGRMTPKGFGESQPIESNSTEAGRAANRRVEIHITSR
jgi:outer membrane protein OmpA-like peptidoglycan-associated protein